MNIKVLIFTFILALALISCAPADSDYPVTSFEYSKRNCNVVISVLDQNAQILSESQHANVEVLDINEIVSFRGEVMEYPITILPESVVLPNDVIQNHLKQQMPNFEDFYTVNGSFSYGYSDYKVYNSSDFDAIEFEPLVMKSMESAGLTFVQFFDGTKDCYFPIVYTISTTVHYPDLTVSTVDSDSSEYSYYISYESDDSFLSIGITGPIENFMPGESKLNDASSMDDLAFFSNILSADGTFNLKIGTPAYKDLMGLLLVVPGTVNYRIEGSEFYGYIDF